MQPWYFRAWREIDHFAWVNLTFQGKSTAECWPDNRGGKAESLHSKKGHTKTALADDQLAQDKSVRALLQNYRSRIPLVLLVDDKYALFPYDLSLSDVAYAVLGFYTIVHAWGRSPFFLAWCALLTVSALSRISTCTKWPWSRCPLQVCVPVVRQPRRALVAIKTTSTNKLPHFIWRIYVLREAYSWCVAWLIHLTDIWRHLALSSQSGSDQT